jgi:hypothetical protein
MLISILLISITAMLIASVLFYAFNAELRADIEAPKYQMLDQCNKFEIHL